MKSRINAIALSLVAVASLAACGGGSSSGVEETPNSVVTSPTEPMPTSVTLTGKVIDGYIEGATVCLDIDANLVCGPGEPKTTSTAGGVFSLDISGLSTSQIQTSHLFTDIPVTAKDSDDGGKTLAQAGKGAFNMMAPATAYINADGKLSPAVISPLTTMVSLEMLNRSGTQIADAESAMRARLGLPAATDMRSDFVATLDANLAQQARVMAAAISQVKQLALAVPGTSNRDAIMIALQYLNTKGSSLFAATPNATPESVTEMVKTALKQPALVPDMLVLIHQAMQYTATNSTSTLSIFSDGFYEPMFTPTSEGIAGYRKVSGVSGNWQTAQFGLANGLTNWFGFNAPTTKFNLTAQGWVADPGEAWGKFGTTSGTISVEPNGDGTVTSAAGYTYKLTSTARDVAGRPVGSIAGLVDFMPKIGSSTTVESTIFGEGAKVYFTEMRPIAEYFQINTGVGKQMMAYNPVSNATTTLASIDELISTYSTKNGHDSQMYLATPDGKMFTFTQGGTVTYWWSANQTCNVGVVCEEMGATSGEDYSYVIKTVHGQQVLYIPSIGSFDLPVKNLMFAAKDGKVFTGTRSPSEGALLGVPLFNKAAINAILKADGKQKVLN